eukprot:m.281909 g.281909  ORF g.281909 m.281909 type:complete len:432 (+) comp16181_c0_seq4:2882-4177(+)
MDTDGHPAEAVFASGAPSHFHNSAYRPSDGPQLPEGGGQGEVAMGRVNSDDNAMDEDPQARRGPPPTERLTFASLHNASSQQERPPRRMSSDYSLEDDKLEEGEEEDGGQRGDEGEDPEAAAVDHAAAAAPHPSSLHHSPSSVARMRGMSEGIARARYVRAAVQAADSDRPWPSPEKMDDEIEQQRIQARRDRNRKFQAKKRKMHKEIVETLTAEAARYEAENARLGREIVTLERKIEALRSGAAKGGAAEALMRVAETRHMMGGSTSLPPTDAEVAAAIAARGHSQMREAGLTPGSTGPMGGGMQGMTQAPTAVHPMYPGQPMYYMPGYGYPPGAMMMPPGMVPAMTPPVAYGAMPPQIPGQMPPTQMQYPGMPMTMGHPPPKGWGQPQMMQGQGGEHQPPRGWIQQQPHHMGQFVSPQGNRFAKSEASQ